MVEKDWHVVRALRVLSKLKYADIRPIFSGGTSLSIGWSLIRRFSEDVDFKVAMPEKATRTQRRTYREAVLEAMAAQDFQIIGEAQRARDASRFFNADFNYPSQFNAGPGLRPHLRLEMSFEPPVTRPRADLTSDTIAHLARPETSARDSRIPLRRSCRNGSGQAERARMACLRAPVGAANAMPRRKDERMGEAVRGDGVAASWHAP
ncbi:nucleotidyl transferase AbiEii/AbiGii toxin family protein [Steroidobacter flavus]|uniref:Nucleotidyl transferase AbiEii/AbiGii toxin family protein n=1 Tax=Steroidobacter flavus TaxID=1842136 RepID=A0ABV8SY53_9GAMM